MDYNLGNDENEEEKYEQIMDKETLKKNRIKIMICMVFVFIADGMEMRVFNLLIKPFGDYFKFDETSLSIQFAASSIFLGIMIGSAIASLLTKKFNRILIINISNFVFFISYLIKGMWMSFPVFVICRAITGLALGIIIPIFMNIFGEYSPYKYRGLLLMITWTVFGVGELISSLTGLIVMPELQTDKLQTFLLVLAVLPFLGFISCVFLLKDSPRGLLLSKKIIENNSMNSMN